MKKRLSNSGYIGIDKRTATSGIISKEKHELERRSNRMAPANTTYEVDFLVVAGGGGGGGSTAGGGGAGGLRTSYGSTSGGGSSAEDSIKLARVKVYTVTIGSGGAGGINGSAGVPNNTNGGDSSISGADITTITSIGGGYGASGRSSSARSANSGGSGGGGDRRGGGERRTPSTPSGHRHHRHRPRCTLRSRSSRRHVVGIAAEPLVVLRRHPDITNFNKSWIRDVLVPRVHDDGRKP